MHKENLEWEKHCKYCIGDYVQACEDATIKNNNKARTLDCLYLRPAGNDQGGHDLLHLPANEVINRAYLITTPINKAIIRQVHALAVKDKMPRGLKIVNRADVTLCDSSWTAGVDYEDKDNQYDDEEEQSQSSKESENETVDERESDYDDDDDQESDMPGLLDSDEDSMSEGTSWSDTDSDESDSDDDDDYHNNMDFNEQADLVNGRVRTAGVQSHINGAEVGNKGETTVTDSSHHADAGVKIEEDIGEDLTADASINTELPEDANEAQFHTGVGEANEAANTEDGINTVSDTRDQNRTSETGVEIAYEADESTRATMKTPNRGNKNSTSPSPRRSDMLSRLKQRRSTRVTAPPQRYDPSEYRTSYKNLEESKKDMHLHAKTDNTNYYTQEEAQVIARVMCLHSIKEDSKRSFAQTYSLKKGLKVFGQKGKEGAYKEMNQLHNRIMFEPVRLQSIRVSNIL